MCVYIYIYTYTCMCIYLPQDDKQSRDDDMENEEQATPAAIREVVPSPG